MALCTLVDRHTYTRPYGVTLQKVAVFLVETQNFTSLGIGEFGGYSKKGEQQADVRSERVSIGI
jgi:hypothetical protein